MNDFNPAQHPRDEGGKFTERPRDEASVGVGGVDVLAATGRQTDRAVVAAAIAEAKKTGHPVLIAPAAIEHNGYWPDENGAGEGMGGDISLGAEPSYRLTWATGDDEEPFVSVTETYYVTARRDGDDRDLDYGDWDDAVRAAKREADRIGGNPEALPKIRYGVENVTEWIGHTDVNEPGGTETRSDYARGEGSALYYETLTIAEDVARRQARETDASHYSPENWK